MEETTRSKRTVLIDSLRVFRPEIQAIDLESMSISDLQHLINFYEIEVPETLEFSRNQEERLLGDVDSMVIDEKSDTESRVYATDSDRWAVPTFNTIFPALFDDDAAHNVLSYLPPKEALALQTVNTRWQSNVVDAVRDMDPQFGEISVSQT